MTTTTTKKPTKKQMFSTILANYALTTEEQAFIKHEIELLEKKNTTDRKLTAVQVANEGLKSDIITHMAQTPAIGKTVSMLIKEVASLSELSNQKVTALMRGLIDEGKIEKRTEKKATVFYIVSADNTEVEGE